MQISRPTSYESRIQVDGVFLLFLESQCEHLKADLEKERTETMKLQKMNEDLEKTKQTLGDLKSKLEKTTLELGKMQSKNRTLSQHDQVRLCFFAIFEG